MDVIELVHPRITNEARGGGEANRDVFGERFALACDVANKREPRLAKCCAHRVQGGFGGQIGCLVDGALRPIVGDQAGRRRLCAKQMNICTEGFQRLDFAPEKDVRLARKLRDEIAKTQGFGGM